MQKIAVLGAGMVGAAIALDLAKQFEVSSLDRSMDQLKAIKHENGAIQTQQLDASDTTKLKNALLPFDLVVCAVPGFMGYQTLKTIIECGKNVVDISFFPEDALALNDLAKKNRVTAIVDCGVAPGLSNLILGYENEQNILTSFECYVGGLPVERNPPYEYKAPFSPIDVIEEYTRPARIFENGKVLTKPALSEIELLALPEIGELEAFNSDGLRSLLVTMKHIPNLKEKTLRYPGHAAKMQDLSDAGFFNSKHVGHTAKVLFEDWKLLPTDDEFTVMQIRLITANKEINYYLFDRRDKTTGISSMSRTTGYTATGAINLLVNGLFDNKGVIPPELIGADPICFHAMLAHLKARKIDIQRSEQLF